jgi:hypothetical protein
MVGDEQGRGRAGRGRGIEARDEVFPPADVETAGRLVEHDESLPPGEGPCEHHALTLAGGQASDASTVLLLGGSLFNAQGAVLRADR